MSTKRLFFNDSNKVNSEFVDSKPQLIHFFSQIALWLATIFLLVFGFRLLGG